MQIARISICCHKQPLRRLIHPRQASPAGYSGSRCPRIWDAQRRDKWRNIVVQTLQPGRASLPSVDAVSAVSVRLYDDAECVVKCDGIGLASMLYSLIVYYDDYNHAVPS